MAKALLVDTNVSSLPIYQYLCNAGHEVYVIGGNPNDFLAKCSRNYIELDYSNVADLCDLIDKLKIDYLIPGCNDVSYKVCAEVNVDGRFPGIETLENNKILNNKKSFRAFALEHNLPVPQVYSENDVENARFPLVIKPVDAFSGRGITIVHDANNRQLRGAIDEAKRHSRDGSCLIEEFVAGQLHSHSAFIVEGSVVSDVIVEEHCTANPFAVDTSRVLSDFPVRVLQKLREVIEKIAKVLQLKDGLVHTQFIRNGDLIWLIEPTRRCPGDLYSRLIEMSTGINYVENYTRPFLGLSQLWVDYSIVKSLVMRHTITSPNGGNFWTLKLTKPIQITEYIALAVSGEFMNPAPSGRIGIVFATSSNIQDFSSMYQATIERKLYRLQ